MKARVPGPVWLALVPGPVGLAVAVWAGVVVVAAFVVAALVVVPDAVATWLCAVAAGVPALSVVVASSILPTPAFEWVTIGAALVGIFGNAWLVRRDGQRFWELYSKVYALPASRTTGEKS